MIGFQLPEIYNPNLESLFRKACRQRTSFEQGSTSRVSIPDPVPSPPMAEKTIREFSVLSSNNVPVGPQVQIGEGFELKLGVIHMVQAIPFCGLPSEDANNHLQ